MQRRSVVTLLFSSAVTLGAASCGAGTPDGPPKAAESTRTSSSEDAGARGDAKASEGCKGGAPKPASRGLSTKVTIDVGGEQRSYDLSVPPAYDPTRPYPIVFVFHGSGGSAEGVRRTFAFESFVADEAVFVYPQGRGGWDLDSPAGDNPDIALFDEILSKLEADLCVDAGRVFATGFSNGGYFSNQLGCRRGDELRAIASHGGGGPYGNDDAYDEEGNLVCSGSSPAALVVHGASDQVVGVSEAQSSLKHWRWANGCSDAESPRPPEPCVAWGGCSPPVVTCQIPDLGHGLWSEGARVTWEFFAAL